MPTREELTAKIANLTRQKDEAKAMLVGTTSEVDRQRILDFIAVLNDSRQLANERLEDSQYPA
jgi:hypothetical protein